MAFAIGLLACIWPRLMSNRTSRTTARILLGLLLAINLFNFIDRYVVAAVEPSIRATFFAANDPNAMAWSGGFGTAFTVSYMLSALGLGWLGDRFSRWVIIGAATIVCSSATAASGATGSIAALLISRIFVGIGEGVYNPAAPPVISDLFPAARRGITLAIFFATVPVGGALGYMFGGLINLHLGWRAAFYVVSVPGMILGLLCLFQKEPESRIVDKLHQKISV